MSYYEWENKPLWHQAISSMIMTIPASTCRIEHRSQHVPWLQPKIVKLPKPVDLHIDWDTFHGFSLASAWLQLGFSLASALLQLGYTSTNINRTGLRLMDLCYNGWTDRVPQKAPTSTLPFIRWFKINKQQSTSIILQEWAHTWLQWNSRSCLAFLGSSWAHNWLSQ